MLRRHWRSPCAAWSCSSAALLLPLGHRSSARLWSFRTYLWLDDVRRPFPYRFVWPPLN
ncbi:exported protein of unknown function (plasmid) [Cupriavidus taiwanensis]|uniref:Uncharacterized protein n=1 Tax=Cupriavidus taiwanensis TaxID=164546 RepID=A0A375HMB3_9BURK|nr:exported hypothetical protein [Cupriavidus taiwanensis]SOZ71629.1 exported hypothetical protein [Cupriavidus taiwanensis]SOZ86868.1 exported hypothetical protein [Cupriavidus taiwanensis]SOZ89964.1 exported hypothetical protein [Cupriavidus taiwanensis]SOZ94566.1 exported hypothetical protein [Cupriavidus taiwanensis]